MLRLMHQPGVLRARLAPHRREGAPTARKSPRPVVCLVGRFVSPPHAMLPGGRGPRRAAPVCGADCSAALKSHLFRPSAMPAGSPTGCDCAFRGPAATWWPPGASLSHPGIAATTCAGSAGPPLRLLLPSASFGAAGQEGRLPRDLGGMQEAGPPPPGLRALPAPAYPTGA